MGKLTDIYNIVWRLPEYSVFLFYCVCKPFRFFSAHFLQVKFWNLGRGDRKADRHRLGI